MSGNDPAYQRAHWRVFRANGPASAYPCIQCGSRADHWAYQHSAENELTSSDGWAYSESVEDYRAMCRSCHRILDQEMMTDEQREALRLAQSGAISGCRILRRCDECGLVSHAAGVGKHQKARGHKGHTDIKE